MALNLRLGQLAMWPCIQGMTVILQCCCGFAMLSWGFPEEKNQIYGFHRSKEVGLARYLFLGCLDFKGIFESIEVQKLQMPG